MGESFNININSFNDLLAALGKPENQLISMNRVVGLAIMVLDNCTNFKGGVLTMRKSCLKKY